MSSYITLQQHHHVESKEWTCWTLCSRCIPSLQSCLLHWCPETMQRVHGIYLRPRRAKEMRSQRHQMPLCKYGAACNRGKSCIYRHEKVPKDNVDRRKVCLAYLQTFALMANDASCGTLTMKRQNH